MVAGAEERAALAANGVANPCRKFSQNANFAYKVISLPQWHTFFLPKI
jgi:hypothetical protein